MIAQTRRRLWLALAAGLLTAGAGFWLSMPDERLVAERGARLLHAWWPQAKWDALRVDRWPRPHVHLMGLSIPDAGLAVRRADFTLELAPLLLRRKVRIAALSLIDARWKPAKSGDWRQWQAQMARVGRVHVLRARIDLPYGKLTDVFLDLRRSRGTLQWEARARVGHGGITSFGFWRMDGRGHGKLSLDRVPVALFPPLRRMMPSDARLSGSFAFRRTSGWYARGELVLNAKQRRWAQLRARVQADPRGGVSVHEAFAHFPEGHARLKGGCDAQGLCRLQLAGNDVPAVLLHVLWPQRALPPERIEGLVNLDLAVERARGWHLEGQIVPHGVRLVRGQWQARLPDDVPIALTWGQGHIRLAWRHRGEGALVWQKKRAGVQMQMSLSGEAWQGWLGDLMAAHGWGMLEGEGALVAKISLEQMRHQSQWRVLLRGNDAHLQWLAPSGAVVEKPPSAAFRLDLRARHDAHGWLVHADRLQLPGARIEGLRLRLHPDAWTARARRLLLDAGAWHLREGALPWQGRIEGGGAIRWQNGRIAAVDGHWRFSDFQWHGWRFNGEVQGNGRKIQAEGLSVAGHGIDARLRLSANVQARYARIDLMRWQIAPEFPLAQWKDWLRHWHDWRFDGVAARGSASIAGLTMERAHGSWRWDGASLRIAKLNARAAGGRLQLQGLALSPLDEGWRFDGKFTLKGLRLQQWPSMHQLFGFSSLSGFLAARLWLRGDWPMHRSQWRSSGDVALYRLQATKDGARFVAKKLELRYRFDGERLRVRPAVLITPDEQWHGAFAVLPDGQIQGEFVNQKGKRRALKGSWHAFELE